MNGTTAELKRKIMMRLAKDPKIFELIGNTTIDPECPDDLIYTNIFPFSRVNYTVQDSGVYICINIDYPEISHNELYKDTELTFYIICNDSFMKVSGGYCRTDAIAERIIELFDWTTDLGFRIELKYEDEKPVDANFYYRRLVFTSYTPNGVKNGRKIN